MKNILVMVSVFSLIVLTSFNFAFGVIIKPSPWPLPSSTPSPSSSSSSSNGGPITYKSCSDLGPGITDATFDEDQGKYICPEGKTFGSGSTTGGPILYCCY